MRSLLVVAVAVLSMMVVGCATCKTSTCKGGKVKLVKDKFVDESQLQAFETYPLAWRWNGEKYVLKRDNEGKVVAVDLEKGTPGQLENTIPGVGEVILEREYPSSIAGWVKTEPKGTIVIRETEVPAKVEVVAPAAPVTPAPAPAPEAK